MTKTRFVELLHQLVIQKGHTKTDR